MVAVAKNRPHSVNHVLRAKISSGGNNGVSRRKPTDLADDCPAFFKNDWTSGTMDRAIDAASAEQRRIGCIHDGVACFFRNVSGTDDLEDLCMVQNDAHISLP